LVRAKSSRRDPALRPLSALLSLRRTKRTLEVALVLPRTTPKRPIPALASLNSQLNSSDFSMVTTMLLRMRISRASTEHSSLVAFYP